MSKILSGAPAIFDLNPYEQSNVQQHPFGAKAVARNGDIYRYTRIISTGTDLVAGNLYVATANEDNHVDKILGADASVGDTSIELAVGGTQVDANEYDEGLLAFVDTTPEGESYLVTSHDASAGGSEDITVNIEPALTTAATTASQASLIRNPWNNPSANQNIAEVACGVAVTAWDVSVANFGWLKTRGLAAVKGDSTGVTDGRKVSISNELNGAVGVPTTVVEMIVGQAMDAAVNAEFHPVYLTID